MRITRTLTIAATLTGVVAALTVATDGAGAAGKTAAHFTGIAAGSYVAAVGNTVTSGFTAQSSVDSLTPGAHDAQTAADVNASKLVHATAVSTSLSTAKAGSGYTMTARSKSTGVSLLGGLITADVIDTISTATIGNGAPTHDVSTTFVGLKVAKVNLPLTIKKNTSVTIPGVATVALDYGVGEGDSGAVSSRGAGLLITLLQGLDNIPANTTVMLNPVNATITIVGVGYRILGGYGYATRAVANVDDSLQANLSGSGMTSVPASGTSGKDVTDNTAGLNLPPVVTARTLGSTANGVAAASHSYATESVEIAGVNLLGGLITADALKGTAHIEANGASAKSTATTQLVNLRIGGKSIPADVSPNTTIKLLNVGTVTVNAQGTSDQAAMVRLLDIKLSTAAYGLKAGAEIEVGTALVYLMK